MHKITFGLSTLLALIILVGCQVHKPGVDGGAENALAQQAYNKIMRAVLNAAPTHSLGGGASDIGKPNPYRELHGGKALSACIQWAGTRVEDIQVVGYYISYRETASHLYLMKNQALSGCEQYFSNEACECQIVDVNDKNRLEVPSDWAERVTNGPDGTVTRTETAAQRREEWKRRDPADVLAKAQCGDADAQFDLGYRHLTGGGVEQDSTRAYFWYGIANSGGVGLPPREAPYLSRRVSPEQIAEAERLIAEWEPKDCTAEEITSPSD